MQVFFSFVSSVFGIFLIFGLFKYLDIPAGDLRDWIIGVAAFGWLTLIVVVPWNAYFKAREVIDTSKQSAKRDLIVNTSDIEFAKSTANKALLIAVSLHIVSSAAFYLLSVYEITPIGYIGAIVALLLTLLRPVERFYEYIQTRLRDISNRMRYPIDDVKTLLDEYAIQKEQINSLIHLTNIENPDSWVSLKEKQIAQLEQKLNELAIRIDSIKHQLLVEQDKIRNEARNTIAQLSEDSAFLSHVKEIIRFFKNA